MTQTEKEALRDYVVSYLIANSQTINGLPDVTSLDGISSFPVIQQQEGNKYIAKKVPFNMMITEFRYDSGYIQYKDLTNGTWINIISDVELVEKIDLSRYVNIDMNQIINGIKTFNDSPIVPDPTTSFQAVNKKYTDDGLSLKVNKSTEINSGNGLTGGGNLLNNITLNIESANDGILINSDNIELQTVNNLYSESTTKPLSSLQGKILNDTKVDKTITINNYQLKNDISLSKSDIGLSNVDNTSDMSKPISESTQSALNLKADLVNGQIPASQLPSYVDDILEYPNLLAFPLEGENGKLYVDLQYNLTYRWSGSIYVEVGKSLALGETDSTAYRGDRGKAAYDHSLLKDNPHSVTKTQVGLSNVDNTSDINKPISTNQQTALNAKADKTTTITAGAGLTGGGDLSSNKTINIASANDGITINADNIQLNTIDNLTATSTTKPLSANQGKVLNEKVAQVETDLNEKTSYLTKELGKKEVYTCNTTDFRYIIPLYRQDNEYEMSFYIKTISSSGNLDYVILYSNESGEFASKGTIYVDQKVVKTIDKNATEIRLVQGSVSSIGDSYEISTIIVSEISNNKDDIKKISSDVDIIDTMISGNLITRHFDDGEIENGYYYTNSGIKTYGKGYITTFIDISNVDTISAESPILGSIFNLFDANRNFIKNIGNWVKIVNEQSTPINARYIAISSDAKKAYSVTLKLLKKYNINEKLTLKREFNHLFVSANPVIYIDVSKYLEVNEVCDYRVISDKSVNNLTVFANGVNGSTNFFTLGAQSLNTWYKYTYDGIKNYIGVWQDTANSNNNINVRLEFRFVGDVTKSVAIGDIADDLTTSLPDAPLSSNQGVILSKISEKYDSSYSYTRTLETKFIKSLHLDCGRKYISPANIKLLIDKMQLAGLNMLQLYMWDIQGFRFALDDWNVVVKGKTYNLSTALGDHEQLPSYPVDHNTNPTPWITQTEMDDIINYANSKGIEIVPSFDMPGAHMGAINNAFPTLAGLTGDGLTFKLEIIKKLCTYFKSRGSRFYNIGGDESGVGIDAYAIFMQTALRVISQYDLTPIVWNDEICKNGLLNPYINNGVIVMPWKRMRGENTIANLKNSGYRIMNCCYDHLYCTFLVDFWDELTETSTTIQTRFSNLQIDGIGYFHDGTNTSDFFGSSMCIWNDSPELFGESGWNGDKVIELSAPYISIFGQECTKYEERARWQNYCKMLESRIAALENA